jgi:hypothetical protein
MNQYLLLLYDNQARLQKLSPEEMQKAMQKYMDWTKKSVLHKRLHGTGRVIRPNGGGAPVTSDGPYSEAKEVLGGFYTVEAADYDEAVKIALTHPHVEYGGTVEVRQIMGM